jgi:hypothetical protein
VFWGVIATDQALHLSVLAISCGVVGAQGAHSMNRTRSAGDVFQALADPTGRVVIRCLSEEGQVTATGLAARLPVSRQAVTKHSGCAGGARVGGIGAGGAGAAVPFVTSSHG